MVLDDRTLLVVAETGARAVDQRQHGRRCSPRLGSALLVDLWCPVGYVPHLLLGHVLPIAILSVAGGLIGGRVLGIMRRR